MPFSNSYCVPAAFAYNGTITALSLLFIDERIAPELTSFLQWIVIYYPTMAVGVASTYVFQGVGRGLTAMFQTILRETIFTLLFTVLLAIVFDF